MPIDFTTDPNPRYLYVAELHHPFPDWVARTSIPSFEQFAKKASAAFADPEHRLLPISDKVSTFHSAINLFAQVNNFPETAFDRVKEACDFFGISEEVAPYAEVFADRIEKSAHAAPPTSFAIDEVINNSRFQLLPLEDAMDVEDAGFQLSKMASENRVHFIHFARAARKIVKAAEDKGVYHLLPPVVVRVGSERAYDMTKAAKLIEGRANYAKGADASEVQASYLEALQDADPDAAMEKIAAIDSAVGITHRYQNGAPLLLPSDIVYNGPLIAMIEKVAKEHAAIGNVLIPLDELKKIDRRGLVFHLSKEAGESLVRVLDESDDATDVSLLVDSWVPDDRRVLLRLASAV